MIFAIASTSLFRFQLGLLRRGNYLCGPIRSWAKLLSPQSCGVWDKVSAGPVCQEVAKRIPSAPPPGHTNSLGTVSGFVRPLA